MRRNLTPIERFDNRLKTSHSGIGMFAIFCLVSIQCLVFLGCRRPVEFPKGEINGNSMAPTFRGEHYQVECGHCRYAFRCDIDQANERDSLICPNCAASISIKSARVAAADLVLIKPPQNIQRWDVVTFKLRGEEQTNVKRVVGLPGETVEFVDGNLVVANAVLRKHLSLQKILRIPVYDSRFPDPSMERWSSKNAAWNRTEEGGFVYQPPPESNSNNAEAVLNYIPKRCYVLGKKMSESPGIEDNFGFNQSVSRDLNRMDEVMLGIQLVAGRTMVFDIEYVYGDSSYRVNVDLAHRKIELAKVASTGESAQHSVSLPGRSGEVKNILLSTFDQQLIVAINEEELLRFELPKRSGKVAKQPIRIVGKRTPLQFESLQLWRDNYYLGPDGLEGAHSQLTASSTEYILLGDNAPISIDSRLFEPPGIPKSQITGLVEKQ